MAEAALSEYLVQSNELHELSDDDLIDFCLRLIRSGNIHPASLSILKETFKEMANRGMSPREYALLGKELQEALDAAGGKLGLN